MIEVAPNLFVGSQNDLIHVDDGNGGIKDGWYVIAAAKEPWHRAALGYTGRGAPKDHPEYLMALRPRRLILNLVDVADPTYIRDDIIDMAIKTIDLQLAEGNKVLIHCNEGKSRAPTIAMLWRIQDFIRKNNIELDDDPKWVKFFIEDFKSIYPDYAPAEGMRLYAQARLEKMLAQ